MFKFFGRKDKKENHSAKETGSFTENNADDLQFDILRKLHEYSDSDFDLDQVGFTDEESNEVIKSLDAFDIKNLPAELFGGTAFTESNLSRAKLALQYKMSCDSTLYWVITVCVGFRISMSQGRQKETLLKALKKLADYTPVKKAVYTL